MKLSELLAEKRAHAARLTNTRGATGETLGISAMPDWKPRPKGNALKVLLGELAAVGIHIRRSSFDAIALAGELDFEDRDAVRRNLDAMTFVEIKSATQSRVKAGFDGFFFALTEGEIEAAEQLGRRHMVALHNTQTGEIMLTSIPEILERAKSMTWQLSVQL